MTPEEKAKLVAIAKDIHDRMTDQVIKGIKVDAGMLTRWEQKIRRLVSDSGVVAEAKGEAVTPEDVLKALGKWKN